MNIEDFRNIIELQRIEDNSSELEHLILQEEIRLKRLIEQKSDKLVESQNTKESLINLKKEISSVEKNLNEAEKRLSRVNDNIMQTTTNQQLDALKNEQESLKKHIAEYEESGFLLYEKVDELEKQLKDISNFLEGFEKTYSQIKTESDGIVSQNQDLLKSNIERENNLLSITDKLLESSYRSLAKQFKYKKRIAFINNQCCTICRFQIPKVVQSAVEKASTVEMCPGCGRILIPHSVVLT